MNFNICLIEGDYVGKEVIPCAKKILEKVGQVYGHEFKFVNALAGGAAVDKRDDPLPKETIEIAKQADSVLLGAVGGPKYDNLPKEKRPEKAILGLRKELKLFANLRPAILFKELIDASPIKNEIIEGGIDILVVRELTGGIYFGERDTFKNEDGEECAYDKEEYKESEIKRIATLAFELAKKRNGRVTSVDKANVLDSSRLWRKVVEETKDKNVELSHMYVDNASMQLVKDPKSFDVLLTNNIFGDILSDEASQVVGSIGMLPSASLGERHGFGLYEPIHGSAPDIFNKDEVNPIATILSAGMMLKYSFGLEKEYEAINKAVSKFLSAGHRTKDIFKSGTILVGTRTAAAIIEDNIN